MSDNIQIWYIDKNGSQLGSGFSSEKVGGSVDTPPKTPSDIWNGSEWITPEPMEPTESELIYSRIEDLKQKLRDTDYVALPDYDKDKPDILADRQAWRDEIRSLEV